jgi:molecular chaperone Hsp33
LHSASRPWNELTAWTINFQEPLVNLFLTGDNDTGAITGRVFDENVKELPENIFYADVVCGREPKRRSAVSFTGSDPIAAAEKFYAQSEQRVARYFQIAEEEFAMVTELPDCDLGWLNSLTTEQVRSFDTTETLGPMERRIYRWHCGCNQQRMMEVLAPTMRQNPAELFGDEEKLEIRCPRCGARHAITRESMEAFIAPSK